MARQFNIIAENKLHAHHKSYLHTTPDHRSFAN